MVFLLNICVVRKIVSSEVSVDSDIHYMSAVKFLVRLDLEQKTSFLDRHSLTSTPAHMEELKEQMVCSNK